MKSQTPGKDAAKLMLAFAQRAFRRPVEQSEIAPYVQAVHQSVDDGETFVDALKGGYRALLCSPRFLYFTERPGRLDDFAIASRLSYFLWNTMPDDKLLALAEKKKLSSPQTVKLQVERMLNDPRGRNFVKDFAHEWLDLSEIDFTQPDRRRFREFDVIVQETMLEETHAFLQAMLQDDLSVVNLVDSDFTYANSRLADYYGIDGVNGDELQRVKLKPDSHRGGVLTHGSILKVTANGTTTSPVLRGVWVAERLLGAHIPPPPEGIPAIEPDIRGAKTIRDQLDKHKSDPNCAACHRMIDPPGFALENFDPAGQWRTRYPISRKKTNGPRIDSSYKMSGRSFSGIDEFRKLIASRPERLAKNVAEKLITYGTGSAVSFADRQTVRKIVESTADNNYGFRSILHAVIASRTFLSK